MTDDSNFPYAFVDSDYLLTTQKPVYFLVIASQDRFYDCIRFFMNGISMTSFYAAIFTPTSATSLTRIMNLGNVKSQMSGAGPPYLRTITLPDPLDAVAGEKFYVGLLAVGGTMPYVGASTKVAGVGYGSTTDTVPRWTDLSALDSGTQSDFSNTTETITAFSMGGNGGNHIWGALGTAAVAPRGPAFFGDNYSTINQSGIPLPWAGRSGIANFGVYNQTASPQTGATGAFQYLVPSMRNNDHYAQVRLGADMATDVNWDGSLYVGVRGARGGTGEAVKLHIKPGGTRQFRIVTVTTSYNNGGLTQRAAADPVPEFAAGGVAKLVAQGSLYVALYNDKPVITWNDTGVVSPVDANHQRVSIAASATSTANLQLVDNFEAGAYGGGIALVSPNFIPSAETFYDPTVVNGITLTPGRAVLQLAGRAPNVVTNFMVLQPGRASVHLVGREPALSTYSLGPQFDSAALLPGGGNGAYTTGGALAQADWVHNAGGSNRAVIVAIAAQCDNQFVAYGANYNGVSMTHLGTIGMNNDPKQLVSLYGMLNPPTGEKTVSAFARDSSARVVIAATSVSYTGVADFSSPSSVYGSGNPHTHTATTATNTRIVQAFGDTGNGGFSAYSQTERKQFTANLTKDCQVVIGDAIGTGANITFAATGDNSAWGSVARRLVGI